MFSKSAIGHGTASLAHELLPLGVRVNGFAPGVFVTEMSAPGSLNELGQSQLAPNRKFPLEVPVSYPVAAGQQRAGTRRDMATLVLFLVANWFVDGETVLIDGGVSRSRVTCFQLTADDESSDIAQTSILLLGTRLDTLFRLCGVDRLQCENIHSICTRCSCRRTP